MSEERALAALDVDALLADAAALVRVPSVTGDERAVVEQFASRARARGLATRVVAHDLRSLRSDPAYPGEETDRSELFTAVAVAPGHDPAAPRLCLNGHLDVVHPGSERWARDPWSGTLEDGKLHGRGSVDMKAAVVALMHAAAAVATAGGANGDVVVQAVSSEEDGGLGTFAALTEDAAFAACVVAEPTGFELACAQAGALTFTGEIPGVAAHAAVRLEGVSAIERFVAVHGALAELERELNSDVAHPLMQLHELPYPLSIGRVDGGRWSSSVPDRLEFEGRVGVPVGMVTREVRARFGAAVAAACPEAAITWSGGCFAAAETDPGAPIAQLVAAAAHDELGREVRPVGVTYGADMRLFCERGIPCVMFGTPGLERAHAVDEYVFAADLVTLARTLIRVIARF